MTLHERSEQAANNRPTSEQLDPIIVIPFAKDPHFVERGTILDEVTKKCAAGSSRAALFGLGGVG